MKKPILINIWTSEELLKETKDQNGYGYDIAESDMNKATKYWNVWFDPEYIVFKEGKMDCSNEDIVPATELDTPKGAKLKLIFNHVKKARRGTEYPNEQVNVFYFNIDKLGASDAIGRTYLYDNSIYIVMPIRKVSGSNTFSHEIGHTIYHSNPLLDGNDPVSGAPHHTNPKNLIYHETNLDLELQLEQKQLDAVMGSWLCNSQISPKQSLSMKTYSIDLSK